MDWGSQSGWTFSNVDLVIFFFSFLNNIYNTFAFK